MSFKQKGILKVHFMNIMTSQSQTQNKDQETNASDVFGVVEFDEKDFPLYDTPSDFCVDSPNIEAAIEIKVETKVETKAETEEVKKESTKEAIKEADEEEYDEEEYDEEEYDEEEYDEEEYDEEEYDEEEGDDEDDELYEDDEDDEKKAEKKKEEDKQQFEKAMRAEESKYDNVSSKSVRRLLALFSLRNKEKEKYFEEISSDQQGEISIKFEDEFLRSCKNGKSLTDKELKEKRVKLRQFINSERKRGAGTKSFSRYEFFYREVLRSISIELLKSSEDNKDHNGKLFYDLLVSFIKDCQLAGSYEIESFGKFLSESGIKKNAIAELSIYKESKKFGFASLLKDADLDGFRKGVPIEDFESLKLDIDKKKLDVLGELSDEEWILLTLDEKDHPIIHRMIYFIIQRFHYSNDFDMLEVLFTRIPIGVWICPWAVDKHGCNPIQTLAILFESIKKMGSPAFLRARELFKRTLGDKHSIRLVKLDQQSMELGLLAPSYLFTDMIMFSDFDYKPL
jgi:hypothetical protein